jgi:hypothetical protein
MLGFLISLLDGLLVRRSLGAPVCPVLGNPLASVLADFGPFSRTILARSLGRFLGQFFDQSLARSFR